MDTAHKSREPVAQCVVDKVLVLHRGRRGEGATEYNDCILPCWVPILERGQGSCVDSVALYRRVMC